MQHLGYVPTYSFFPLAIFPAGCRAALYGEYSYLPTSQGRETVQWRESTSLLFQMLCFRFAYKGIFALSDTLAANTFPIMIKPGKLAYKEIIASGPKLFYM